VRLQFDGNQALQLRAIESVADLLRGQPRRISEFSLVDAGSMFGPVVNRLDLNEDELLANLQAGKHEVHSRKTRRSKPSKKQ